MLLRKGVFTRLDAGADGHSRDYLNVWRKVLDEMLIALVSTDTSAQDHSMRWFNSQPGTPDYFIDDKTGTEYTVDMHEEYVECCSLANLDPKMVRETAMNVYYKIKEEDEKEREIGIKNGK